MKINKGCVSVLFLLLSLSLQTFANSVGKKPVDVTLQLQWKHQFQFAGYYAAIEKGYYKDAGLHVKLREINEKENPVQSVLTGNAQFGTGSTSLLYWENEKNHFVILASIFQHSARVFIVRENSGIKHLNDLKNKRVAMEPMSLELDAFLKNEGLNLDTALKNYQTDNVQNLIDGKVDVISGYTSNEPTRIEEAGVEYRLFSPLMSGIDFYGDVLYTTKNYLQMNPEVVAHFREASLKGWRYAMDHPEEIVDLIYSKYSRLHTKSELMEEAEHLNPLIMQKVVEIGYSNPDRWRQILEVTQNLGMIDKSVQLKGMLYSDYDKTTDIPWKLIGFFTLILIFASVLLIIYNRIINKLKTEIKHRKKIQEELSESEQLSRSILSASPDTICITDFEGILTFATPNIQDVFGFSADQMVGQPFFNILPEEEQLRAKNVIRQMFQGNNLGIIEFKAIHSDGSLIFVDVNAEFIRDVTGQPTSIVSIIRNATERNLTSQKIQEQNQRLQKLLIAIEQSPVIVMITDLNVLVEYVNPAFTKITGYSASEVIGKVPSVLKSGLTSKVTYEEMWKALHSGQQWNGEWINKKKDGTFYWEEVTITPIFDETGQMLNYLAVKQDITERKAAEKKILELNTTLEERIQKRTAELALTNKNLKKEVEVRTLAEKAMNIARQEAEKANIAKSEFLSRLSHELRTPMISILGFGQLLEMSELNASQSKGVGHIMRSGKHLLELINEILDISRIESGRLALSLEPVSLYAVILEMTDVIRPTALTMKIQMELPDIANKPIFVHADRQRLKQVILNILNNAVKYNKKEGTIQIRMDAHSDEIGKESIRLSIIDSGLGINEQDLEKIFTPFERIGAEKTEVEGSGLGLSVVQKLISAMGGKVGVESVLNEGSTFWFELPKDEGPLLRNENISYINVK